MTTTIRRMMEDTSGATLVEYTLILTMIAIIAIGVIKLLGSNTCTLLNSAASTV